MRRRCRASTIIKWLAGTKDTNRPCVRVRPWVRQLGTTLKQQLCSLARVFCRESRAAELLIKVSCPCRGACARGYPYVSFPGSPLATCIRPPHPVAPQGPIAVETARASAPALAIFGLIWFERWLRFVCTGPLVVSCSQGGAGWSVEAQPDRVSWPHQVAGVVKRLERGGTMLLAAKAPLFGRFASRRARPTSPQRRDEESSG